MTAAPCRYFELVAWSRRVTRELELDRREAHVLTLLVAYANENNIERGHFVVWPKIATLARDAGLKVHDGRNTLISWALERLEDRKLIWRRQAGVGHAARTELLYTPPAGADGKPPARTERTEPPAGADPPDPADTRLPDGRSQKYKGTSRATTTTTTGKSQRTPPAGAEGSRLPPEDDEERREIRRLTAHLRWRSLEDVLLDPTAAEALRESVDGEWIEDEDEAHEVVWDFVGTGAA